MKFLECGGQRNELFVLLHGFHGAGNRLEAIRRTIRAERPDADIYAPQLPVAKRRLCRDSAESIVACEVSRIDELIATRTHAGGEYRSITIVGHSMGAVLARKIAIVAHGEQVDAGGDRPAPFEPELAAFRERRKWPPIQRMILFAGMNRGWSTSSAMSWWTAMWWSFLQLVSEIIFKGKLTIFSIRKGAPFLVQTRLQWLALMDPGYGARPDLITVQLLGTIDDMVAPDDNVDFSVDFFEGAGRSYFYVEVSQSGHGDVVEMSGTGPPDDAEKRRERRDKFVLALKGSREELTARSISREEMADNLPPEPDARVTDVVFVIHGIRDKGFWTQKVAGAIKKESQSQPGKKFESWTESYGYFAMLPFLSRAVRQRKVEWLMDRYAEARARYPAAAFHYVGHSNGTYLAAQALQDYPAARFKRIVFAGSVVRADYDWRKLLQPLPGTSPPVYRVEKVLNYVATKDWVVALFPKALQSWPGFNLGGAGHDGFEQGSPSGPVYQVEYISGSHGAGHEESHWRNIARFIVTGDPPDPTRPPLEGKQVLLWRIAGMASFVVFPFLLALVIASAIFLFGSIFASRTASAAGLHAIGFFVYLWVVYLFVTRF